MKKIFLILFFSLFMFVNVFGYETSETKTDDEKQETTTDKCKYDEKNSDIKSILNNCKPSNVVGKSSEDFRVEGGLKTKVNNIIKNLSLIIGIIAVGALVYAGFLMQISAGEDEQIKKAKDIIKWTIIGFLGLISAGGIIYIVINFMYAVGS